MTLPTKVIYVACFAIFAFSCSPDNLEDDMSSALSEELIIPEAKSIEIEILELINEYRVSKGLSNLRTMDIVKYQAFSHTDYMIAQNNISHDYFFSRKAFLESQVGATAVSENVAYGYSYAESLVNAWINSDSHRATIEGDFTDFDISAEKNEDGVWFYTNIFVKK
jgi:uncharacterized protein YkwD